MYFFSKKLIKISKSALERGWGGIKVTSKFGKCIRILGKYLVYPIVMKRNYDVMNEKEEEAERLRRKKGGSS